MKNREKYAEEIKNYKDKEFCKNFIIPIILKKESCYGTGCMRCIMLQMLWLEEEYEEPEVDWSKVAVDTPILVRDSDCQIWEKRCFAKFENGKVYAWLHGSTSWTAEHSNSFYSWNYAKLAEQEESDE